MTTEEYLADEPMMNVDLDEIGDDGILGADDFDDDDDALDANMGGNENDADKDEE